LAFAPAGLAAHSSRLRLGRPSLPRIFWNDKRLAGKAISLTASTLAYLSPAANAPRALSLAISMERLPRTAAVH
jgi:hypothetical protein